MNIDLLNALHKKIECLPETSHFEVFKIIKKYNIPYNENSNGIFINMSHMKNDCIEELTSHINWLEEQKSFMQTDEKKKEQYRENFFT